MELSTNEVVNSRPHVSEQIHVFRFVPEQPNPLIDGWKHRQPHHVSFAREIVPMDPVLLSKRETQGQCEESAGFLKTAPEVTIRSEPAEQAARTGI